MKLMARVNLIPAHLRQRRRVRLRRKGWTAAAVAYTTTLLVVYGTWRVAVVTTPVNLSAEVARIETEIADKSAEALQLRGQLAEERAALRVATSMSAQPDWGLLLALLAKTRGDDIVLKRCDLSAQGEVLSADAKATPVPPVLRLIGMGQNQAAVSRFALRLEQTGLFESIEPVSNRETFDHGEVIGFRFECRLAAKSAAKVAQNDMTEGVP
jgi:hypothetical protein